MRCESQFFRSTQLIHFHASRERHPDSVGRPCLRLRSTEFPTVGLRVTREGGRTGYRVREMKSTVQADNALKTGSCPRVISDCMSAPERGLQALPSALFSSLGILLLKRIQLSIEKCRTRNFCTRNLGLRYVTTWSPRLAMPTLLNSQHGLAVHHNSYENTVGSICTSMI